MATISHSIFCKTKHQANAFANKKITEIVRIHKKNLIFPGGNKIKVYDFPGKFFKSDIFQVFQGRWSP